MGVGLEPVLGLLRFLAQLIAAVDEKLAKLLKHAAPLPYFALSHLLTMLAHDVPTLPLIQHVFDYLLARPPIALVYLVAAMIIERKDELFALNDEDGDLGMLHSLLGALPSMSDGPEPLETEGISAAVPSLIPDPSFPCSVAETATVVANSDELGSSAEDTDETDTLAESDCYSDSDTMKTETVVDIYLHDTENRKAESPLSSPSPLVGRSPTPPLQVHSESELFSSPPPLYSDDQEITPNDADTSPLSTSPSSPLDLLDEKPIRSGSVSPNSERTHTPSRRKPSIPLELSSLLRSADQLLEAYPPYEGYPVSVDSDQASHTLPDSSSDIPFLLPFLKSQSHYLPYHLLWALSVSSTPGPRTLLAFLQLPTQRKS
ncbi:hypothetical protein BT96DRAFT_1016215 [Gymnopus androsaceus JB14]|uniref:Rab-GAP TBC domain-containing protein n=1 Tax=Gymnopus androsaceus JB14 TaxID=1447944 RepID=A0A6A4I6E0_9AGAR|nr:hypothetical protein BT96DRAFT_1016215 [Gymnopus androsaceus JB14]